MGRNATIKIANETGYNLKLVSKNVIHGKFNKNPPETIDKDATITFEVGNHTGAKIGPKGSIKYELNWEEKFTVNLIFYWDHPFGHTSSSYEMGSDPDWFSSYYLDPPNPTGHDQKLTFHARLNDYGFDPKTWMSKLKKETKLRNVLLPGSHDSGTYSVNYSSALCLDAENQLMVFCSNVGLISQWSKAQSNSILDQLNHGIRYLDLRVSDGYYMGLVIENLSIDNVTGDPVICHTAGTTPPQKILDDIAEFIKDNPKEIIIINFQHFYHKQKDASGFYQNLINQLRSAFGSKMIERSSIEGLTLESLWGNDNADTKQIIVLFDQDHVVEKTLKPGSGTNFCDTYKALYEYEDGDKNNKFLWSADTFLSNTWPSTSSIGSLKDKLLEIVNNNNQVDNKLFVLQGVVTPDSKMYQNAIWGGLPKSLEELGNEVTPNVESWIVNDWADKNLNIVMCDWVSNSILTQLCYMINKKKNNFSK